MKKVIFGLLSFLLISPVFADSLSDWSKNNIFEYSNLSYPYRNIYYSMLFEDGSSSYSTLGLQYNNNNIYNISQLTGSLYTGFGGVYDSDLFNNIFSFNNSFVGYSYNGFTGNFLLIKDKLVSSFSFPKLYIQRQSDNLYSGNNLLFKVGSGLNNIGSIDDYDVLSSTYSRYFYYGDNSNNISNSQYVSDYEIFYFGQDYFNTSFGNVYLPGRNNIGSITDSWHNGFSFIASRSGFSMSWSDLKLYSVFPYYNINWSGFQVLRNLSGWSFTDDFFMFNTFDNYTVVLSKDSSNYDDLLYSIYSCTNLYPVQSGNVYYYDFNSFCTLLDGGRLNGILPFTGKNNSVRITPAEDNGCISSFNVSLFNKITAGNTQLRSPAHGFYNSNPYMGYYISGSLSSSHYLCVSSYNTLYSCRGTWNTFYINGGLRRSNCFSLTPEIGVDILNGFDNTVIPPEPLSTGEVVDILGTLCNSSLLKPAFCNGIDQVSTGVDGFWDLDGSGNLIYTLINTDPNNMGWGDITPNGSGGFNIVCSDQDGFGCPLLENAGLSGYLDYGSGFILGTDYYETFFQKTGRFFACPYGYVVLDTNSFLKILNKFNQVSESLGFDFMLPINCSIAAFTHGKNYKFLKDVNLGLNPLMGHIQGPDDPRVYLYRFFDFLLSIALLFFLLKLYHLIF